LTKELHGISAALAVFSKTYGKRTGTRGRLSAAAGARIAPAQRARWAKVRENKGAQAKVVPIRGKRTLSAAARKKIAAAQRARWAKVKGGRKRIRDIRRRSQSGREDRTLQADRPEDSVAEIRQALKFIPPERLGIRTFAVDVTGFRKRQDVSCAISKACFSSPRFGWRTSAAQAR
jgi:hypothetical protein